MSRRPQRARAGLLCVALAVSLAAALPARAADVAPSLPEVSTVLPGHAGDGGPAAQALVNAQRMSRGADGDLLWRDATNVYWGTFGGDGAGRVRGVGADGTIRPVSIPALPEAVRAGGTIQDVFVVGEDAIYVVTRPIADKRAIRVTPSGKTTVLVDEFIDWLHVAGVGPGGELVIARHDKDAESAETWWRTELLSADGTTSRFLSYHPTLAAAVAADGTVFMAAWQGRDPNARMAIERIRPDGTVDLVAGPGPAGEPSVPPETVEPWQTQPTVPEARADGVPATSTRLRAVGLTVTPDGEQVSYVDLSEMGAILVRTFPVGGDVRTVAGADSPADGACTSTWPHLLADEDAVLVACGGIRSYPYDGGSAPHAGTVVAGRNHEFALLDSPTGTPVDHAYLGRMLDLAGDPREPGRVAMVTFYGVHAVEDADGSGGGARLVRLLDSGETAPPRDNWAQRADAAYAPDGTLYLFAADPADPQWSEWERRWRLQRLGPGAEATPTVVAPGTGTAEPADGRSLTDVHLSPGQITVGPDGVLYLSQGRVVYSVAPGSTTLRRVAEIESQSWSVNSLAVGADGRLLVGADITRRLDPDGVLRPVGVGAGSPVVQTADGSFYFFEGETTLWRQRPDGTATVALGRHPDDPDAAPVGAGLGPATPKRLEALPDGRLAIAYGFDAQVLLVDPAGEVWQGDAPTLTASATADPGGRSSTVTMRLSVPAGPDWRVRVQGASDPRDVTLTAGPSLWARTVEPGTVSTTVTAPIGAGDRFTIKLWAWPDNGTSGTVGAPPRTVTVAVPGPATSPTAQPEPTDAPSAPSPAALTLAVPPALRYGSAAVLTGTLRTPGPNGVPIPRRAVDLQSRAPGGAWKRIRTVTTDGNGRFEATHKATRSLQYRAVHAATGSIARAVSGTRAVTVRYAVQTSRTAVTVREGGKVTLTGTVRPGAAGDEVLLQRRRLRDGAWTWQTVGQARLDSTRAYRLSAPAPGEGSKAYFRVRRAAGPGLAAANSVTVLVTVTG